MLIYLLLFILLSVFGLLLWILIAPFTITLDSGKSLYEFKLKNIVRVVLLPEEESMVMKIHAWIYEKEFVFPWDKMISKKEGNEEVKTSKRKKKKFRPGGFTRNIKNVLQTFELSLWANIDTDDYYYNAIFYPIAHFTNRNNIKIHINYSGVNEFRLKLRNRLSRIIYAYII